MHPDGSGYTEQSGYSARHAEEVSGWQTEPVEIVMELVSDTKTCMFCGKTTKRKIYNGSKEPIQQWTLRDWCEAPECVKKGRAYALKRSDVKPGPKLDVSANNSRWRDSSTIHYYRSSC